MYLSKCGSVTQYYNNLYPQEPMIIDNLPFDKYELEGSPLTLYILARKQPKVCWQVSVLARNCDRAEVPEAQSSSSQVYIQGSSKSTESGHPFGYLKASTNLLTVNLFVLPYNYPVLLPLLDELFKVCAFVNSLNSPLGQIRLFYVLGPSIEALKRVASAVP